MRSKVVIRLIFLWAFIVWMAMTFSDIIIFFSDIRDLDPGIPVWIPRVMLVVYVLTVYYYYNLRDRTKITLDFTSRLSQVFFTGLPIVGISLAVRLILSLLGETKILNNILFTDIIYHINLSLFLNLLIAALISWEKLILYQKSKLLVNTWQTFIGVLLFALLLDSLNVELHEYVWKGLIVIFGSIIILLSVNVKWIAYLNIKQKWTSLFFLLLIFGYLYYFRYTIIDLSDDINMYSALFIDFKTHAFGLSIFSFVMLYTIFSFFVILFNLPTSSAFEQKLGEVGDFKRISESVQTEQNEESIYHVLLASAANSAFADAAWIEIKKEKSKNQLFTYQIDENTAFLVKKHLSGQGAEGILKQALKNGKKTPSYISEIRYDPFRSALTSLLVVNDEVLGSLVLLKKLSSGFNQEISYVIGTFTNQARISIENFRLLEATFQHERYKEELKIAQKVHDKLLPSKLDKNEDVDIVAFSRSADGVGGDYYDTIRINDTQVALIIADVSGKGTTAAFHMAQMKGIFHSLARQGLSPDVFIRKANEALVSCLERGAFISAIYFVLDTHQKKIIYSRAGHCPILYYKVRNDQLEYLKDRGMAMGALKNENYSSLVEVNEMNYNPGDIMVLYTDGITEAKNAMGEEYGYQRLSKTVYAVKKENAHGIQDHLITELYAYSGTNTIVDDYTTIIVRFNNNSPT